MSDILSQDEVDALLGAMNEEGGDGAAEEASDDLEVIAYNFRKPSLINKDRLKPVNVLHDNFLRHLESSLGLLTGQTVTANIATVDQILYKEFLESLDKVTHSTLFSISPLPGIAVQEIKSSLLFGLLDILLGGSGEAEVETRVLTEIEKAILNPAFEKISEGLDQSWKSVINVNLSTERSESDPYSLNAAPAGAPVILVTVVVKVGENVNGIINLGYPLPMIERLLENVDPSKFISDNYYGQLGTANYKKQILTVLASIPLPMRAELGGVAINGSDLNELAVGDVIVLDSKVSDPLKIQVGNLQMFSARPGKMGESLGVKIVKDAHKSEVDILDIILNNKPSTEQ